MAISTCADVRKSYTSKCRESLRLYLTHMIKFKPVLVAIINRNISVNSTVIDLKFLLTSSHRLKHLKESRYYKFLQAYILL
jgi:hypothetical protein